MKTIFKLVLIGFFLQGSFAHGGITGLELIQLREVVENEDFGLAEKLYRKAGNLEQAKVMRVNATPERMRYCAKWFNPEYINGCILGQYNSTKCSYSPESEKYRHHPRYKEMQSKIKELDEAVIKEYCNKPKD